MGMLELFQGLAQDLLSVGGIFENIPTVATYYSNTEGDAADYDPTTGIVTPNETAYSIEGVKDKVSKKLLDNAGVYPTDQVFYVAGKKFLSVGLPSFSKPEDRLVIKGVSWNVVQVITDPADAVFIIVIRQP